MKYVVFSCFDGGAWRPRTVFVCGAEPLPEPTEQERSVAAAERTLEEAAGHGVLGPRRRMRGRGEVSSIEAWDAGCRSAVHGSNGEMFVVRTSFHDINNHLDALNLTDTPTDVPTA